MLFLKPYLSFQGFGMFGLILHSGLVGLLKLSLNQSFSQHSWVSLCFLGNILPHQTATSWISLCIWGIFFNTSTPKLTLPVIPSVFYFLLPPPPKATKCYSKMFWEKQAAGLFLLQTFFPIQFI